MMRLNSLTGLTAGPGATRRGTLLAEKVCKNRAIELCITLKNEKTIDEFVLFLTTFINLQKKKSKRRNPQGKKINENTQTCRDDQIYEKLVVFLLMQKKNSKQ